MTPFELPKLPYNRADLEPHISAETLDYHYGKHHQTYVDNLNKLVPNTEFENASLETIIKQATGAIFNNGAQVWNHTFYFDQFSKPSSCKTEPSGKLLEALKKEFGSLEAFYAQFNPKAVGVFGSGWAWLSINTNGKLEIVQSSNADNPLRNNQTPLLTCDVWEHAYYIDKRNARAKYVDDFWKVVNWSIIEERYHKL